MSSIFTSFMCRYKIDSSEHLLVEEMLALLPCIDVWALVMESWEKESPALLRSRGHGMAYAYACADRWRC